MNEHKVGDVVELKSGGPEMTVKHVIGADKSKALLDIQYLNQGSNDGDLICTWFNKDKLKEALFSPSTVELSEEE